MKKAILIMTLSIASCFTLPFEGHAFDNLPSCRDAVPGEACALPAVKQVPEASEKVVEKPKESSPSAGVKEEPTSIAGSDSLLLLVSAQPRKKPDPMLRAAANRKKYESPNLVGYESPLFH